MALRKSERSCCPNTSKTSPSSSPPGAALSRGAADRQAGLFAPPPPSHASAGLGEQLRIPLPLLAALRAHQSTHALPLPPGHLLERLTKPPLELRAVHPSRIWTIRSASAAWP